MKKLTALPLILLILVGLSACLFQPTAPPPPPATPTATATALPPQPTARPTNTPIPALNSPNGPPLRTFAMYPGGNGWGLIYNSLLLTHDGGLNWFSVPIPNGQVNESIQPLFVDANNMFMVLPAADGKSGQLFRTTNGGGTWQVTPVPFLNGQLLFIDQIGFFLETTRTHANSMICAIFTSMDNGLTWNRIYPDPNSEPANSIPDEGIKTGISFINSTNGWVGMASQAQKVSLYRTQDGGTSWTLHKIPVPQNITSLKGSSLPPIFFAGNQYDGLLPIDYASIDTGDRNRIFYSSSDGGENWTPGESIVEGGPYTFLDPQTGWAWGKRGLYFTNDRAQTWQLLPVAFGRSEHATSVRFIDKNTGWLLTADAKNRVRIYDTHDGGNTWTAINP
ncbi:MAG: hypothetical protein WCK35_00825 [Chloroflexota bacterium]